MKKIILFITLTVLILVSIPFSTFAASEVGVKKDIIGGWAAINTAGISYNVDLSDGAQLDPLYLSMISKPVGAIRFRHNMYDLGIKKLDDYVYNIGGTLLLYTPGNLSERSARVYLSCASGVLPNQSITSVVTPVCFSIQSLQVYPEGSSNVLKIDAVQSYSIVPNTSIYLDYTDLGYIDYDDFISSTEALDNDLQTWGYNVNFYITCDTINGTQELFIIGKNKVLSVMKLSFTKADFTDFSVGVYDEVLNNARGWNGFELGFMYFQNITYGYNVGYNAGYDAGIANGDQAKYNECYDRGYYWGVIDGENNGYDSGYTEGYRQGIEEAGVAVDVPGLISTTMQAPATLFTRIFGFEIFDINVAGVLAGALVITIVIFIIKKVIR